VPELVKMLRPARAWRWRCSPNCVIAFFILLGWVGYSVLEILAYDDLVSLPGVSVAYAQSVIPISAALFIVAELLVLPQVMPRGARRRAAMTAFLVFVASSRWC
jgi:TRAP-type transport system small permease protein